MDEFPLICALATNLAKKGEHVEFRTSPLSCWRNRPSGKLVGFERTRGGGTKWGTGVVFYNQAISIPESFFVDDDMMEQATLTYPDGKWVLALPD